MTIHTDGNPTVANARPPASPTHEIYERADRLLREAFGAVRELREADKRFEWECGEIESEIRLSIRYMGKPGEVLYCNWTGCLHAKGEDMNRTGKSDKTGRALLPGEGVQWFKGRVHPDCMKALQAQRH